MREATRRPGGEGAQSADADAASAGGDGEAQQQQLQQRQMAAAHAKKRDGGNAANDGSEKKPHEDAEADAYNQRHAGEVAEFNQLTGDACVGEDGKLDAALVRAWQREHGCAPDGKVGPKTIAAAGGAERAESADATKRGPLAAAVGGDAAGDELATMLDSQTLKLVIEKLEAGPPAASAENAEQDNKLDAHNNGPKVETGKKATDSGLASKISVDAFARRASEFELGDGWRNKSPAERAQSLVEAANDQLRGAGVREVGFRFSSECSQVNPARFDHPTWKLDFCKGVFTPETLDKKAATQLADDVYHESRHAEQNYRIVQTMAGQHKTPDEIAATTGIDAKTIADASAHPIDSNTPEGKAAQAMLKDKYVNKEHHKATETRARDVLKQYYALQKAAEDKSASPEARAEAQKQAHAIKADAVEAWNAYISLATERDAYGVGADLQAAMAKAIEHMKSNK